VAVNLFFMRTRQSKMRAKLSALRLSALRGTVHNTPSAIVPLIAES
jgi:hypothetical protein